MATSDNNEFAHGASELARMRRDKQLHLRANGMGLGVAGLGSGLSSYGSSMGAVTSVQQPVLGAGAGTTAPPVSPAQFAGITTAAPAGDSGTSGTATAAAGTVGAAA